MIAVAIFGWFDAKLGLMCWCRLSIVNVGGYSKEPLIGECCVICVSCVGARVLVAHNFNECVAVAAATGACEAV